MAEEEDYDLILLDILLPGLNGLEVLRRLQQEHNSAPVILLTARDAVMDKVAGLDAGAIDYITKPFAIEELLARIRVALKLHSTAAPALGRTEEPGTFTWKKTESFGKKRHQVTWEGTGNPSYQPGVQDAEDTSGKSGYRAFPGDTSRKGMRIRLYGRNECGGCLRPFSPFQDR